MDKGVKIRTTIHNILYEIYKFNHTIDKPKIKNIIDSYSKRDISFINNVCLNSMRYNIHNEKIMSMYLSKKPKIHERILLSSAITQIVFLDFKTYAVINCTVEIAKKLKIYHGFVNAVLKKVSLNKESLKLIKLKFNELPKWFINETKDLSEEERNIFLSNFFLEPDLHLVFKDEKSINSFEKEIYKTSNISGFVKERFKLEKTLSYKRGNWWVQDFSSSYSLNFIDEKLLDRKNIDLCGAPGGKSFQILSKNKDIVLNDKSELRLNVVKLNLKRLNFSCEILNYDVLKMEIDKKFDFIILDAPCSSVGTIRKNPEIFFKSDSPHINNLIDLQKNLLKKASTLLNINGIILYMVCSFLKKETTDQIDFFLNNNSNFSLSNFKTKDNNFNYNKFIKNKCMKTLPSKIKDYKIDGYFSACLRKNK